MNKLEQRIYDHTYGRYGFESVDLKIKEAARIALELAEQAYQAGRYFGKLEEAGKKTFNDSVTFEQFKEGLGV